MKKINIYGAGLFGLTCGRILHDKGHEVTIYEKNNEIGGALRTWYTPEGIEIHAHGAHIFHTDFEEVNQFIHKYSEWIDYRHKVKAYIDHLGIRKLISLPLSYETLKDFYGVEDISDLDFLRTSTTRMKHPVKWIDDMIGRIGWDLYEYIIKPYSENQWGVPMEKVNKEVIDRIGFKEIFTENYFTDKYQYLPKDGYSNFLNNLSEGLDIRLNKDEFIYENDSLTIFTGPIDDLANDGYLEYRSLRWEFRVGRYDGVKAKDRLPVINTPQKEHTRFIIHNNFSNQPKCETFYVSYEYPLKWSPKSHLERYYPVNNKVNDLQYKCWKQTIEKKYPNLILGGRLGDYKYYDMDDTIMNAINLVNSICKI